ncbi:Uncharacterised protein [Mycobacteroides abscessus subsp. abscessus]|nr:Uncharacterised protein [Mycobacteroides abscessus subsp. abscessus]
MVGRSGKADMRLEPVVATARTRLAFRKDCAPV